MAKYAVSQEGIDALHMLETAIQTSMNNAFASTSRMKSIVASNPVGKGPHYSDIEEIVNEVENAINELEEPTEQVRKLVLTLAETYENIIGMSLGR